MNGKFITLEGNDCSGKTTNAKILVDYLRSKNFDVEVSREPGGTIVAEKIRSIILDIDDSEQVHPLTELLLFSASRAQHIYTKIYKALEAGKIFVCDRFADSTYAYQGVARGYVDKVLQLEEFVHQGFEPDYTLYFDVTLEESLKRLSARYNEVNRLDIETIEFKKKLMRGYQERFDQNPHRMVKIDAMLSPDEVTKQVIAWADKVFKIK